MSSSSNNNHGGDQDGKSSAARDNEESEAEEVKKNFATLVNKVEKRIEELKERETHWAALEVLMEEHASKAAEKITLDIGMLTVLYLPSLSLLLKSPIIDILLTGGQKFAAAKTTLLSHKGSFFDAMLSSGKWKPDSKGRYYL